MINCEKGLDKGEGVWVSRDGKLWKGDCMGKTNGK